MAINTGIVCESTFINPNCHGEMEYSDPLNGGDHDESGKKESFCNDCGSGFKREIPDGKTEQSTFVKLLSKTKLLALNQTMCYISDQPWPKSYSEEQEVYMDILENCETRFDLIKYYSLSPFNIKKSVVEGKIPAVFN